MPAKPIVIDFHAHVAAMEVFKATYPLSVIGRLRAKAEVITVVPAKAGTHNHRRFRWIEGCSTSPRCGVWVPGFAGTTRGEVLNRSLKNSRRARPRPSTDAPAQSAWRNP